MSKPHIVLVHGAYHQPWHMNVLQQQLENAGHPVTSAELVTPNEDPLTEVDLADDVAIVKDIFERVAATSSAIVPVFHSYGGIVGSEALGEIDQSVKDKIKHVVYLAAFVIPQDSSLLDMLDGNHSEFMVMDGRKILVNDPVAAFYHDVEPSLAKDAADHVLPHAAASFVAKTKHAGWKPFNCTYVKCIDDRILPHNVMFDKLEGILQDAGVRDQWSFVEMEGSHSPFLSKPEECAAIIRRAAGESV